MNQLEFSWQILYHFCLSFFVFVCKCDLLVYISVHSHLPLLRTTVPLQTNRLSSHCLSRKAQTFLSPLLPGQPTDKIFSASPGSASGSPPRWTELCVDMSPTISSELFNLLHKLELLTYQKGDILCSCGELPHLGIGLQRILTPNLQCTGLLQLPLVGPWVDVPMLLLRAEPHQPPRGCSLVTPSWYTFLCHGTLYQGQLADL